MSAAPLHFQEELCAAGFKGAFTGRVPGFEGERDRVALLARFVPAFERSATDFSSARRLILADQVHGSHVAVVDGRTPVPVPATDALVTIDQGVCLGIMVADCAPVWLAPRQGGALALVHSGKAGTLSAIVPSAIRVLREVAGCETSSILAFIGPCIRPPHYEMDIAAVIRNQLQDLGVTAITDCGENTAANPERYYSYRRDKGRTGRHVALGVVVPGDCG